MALLKTWRDMAYSETANKGDLQRLWTSYFQQETDIYAELLKNPDEEVKGTVKELAEKTGIRPPTVSAICVGSVKHLPVDALEKICDVLDCQPADLMEYVREPVEGVQ